MRYWPDGRVNNVYPNGDGKRDIPDATEQYVGWVWQTYLTTGDGTQLAALYPVVRNIADYVARAIDPTTGLVTRLPGGGEDYLYGLVDWPPQMRYGYDVGTAARTTENILAVDVFRRVAQMAAVLGRPTPEVTGPTQRAHALQAAIETRLRRPDGVFVDGLEPDGRPSGHASQLANAYAVAYGAVSDRMPAITRHLVALKNRVGVSTFSTLLTALHDGGRDDALVAAITDPNRPGYARILREGGTYIWESWDARQTGDSESHAWGSPVLEVLQQDILGVRVDTPGAAHVTVALPALSMRASGTVATQRGPVRMRWSRARRPGRGRHHDPRQHDRDTRAPGVVATTRCANPGAVWPATPASGSAVAPEASSRCASARGGTTSPLSREATAPTAPTACAASEHTASNLPGVPALGGGRFLASRSWVGVEVWRPSLPRTLGDRALAADGAAGVRLPRRR